VPWRLACRLRSDFDRHFKRPEISFLRQGEL